MVDLKNTGEKLLYLENLLRSMEKVAVAFSGGVDSTFLLYMANRVLGSNAVGIYYDSVLMQERERNRVEELARDTGARLLRVGEVDLSHEAFRKNPQNRCYLCKGLLFDELILTAQAYGFYTVVDGSNLDDESDYRPGKQALKERGVRSPLLEAGLTKQEIRTLSRQAGLATWDKDALACLATRIPHGLAITREKLLRIDALEAWLVSRGYRDVRARMMPEEVILEVRPDQVSELKAELSDETVYRKLYQWALLPLRVNPEGYQRGNLSAMDTP